MKDFGLTLKDFSHNMVIRGDSLLGGPTGTDEPLYWAIRCNNTEAVTYFITKWFLFH